MADFCIDCQSKLHGVNYTKANVILSEDLELCEGCGGMKPVVVNFRRCGCLLGMFSLFFE